MGWASDEGGACVYDGLAALSTVSRGALDFNTATHTQTYTHMQAQTTYTNKHTCRQTDRHTQLQTRNWSPKTYTYTICDVYGAVTDLSIWICQYPFTVTGTHWIWPMNSASSIPPSNSSPSGSVVLLVLEQSNHALHHPLLNHGVRKSGW